MIKNQIVIKRGSTTIGTLTDKQIYGGVEYNKIINTDTDLQVGDVASAYIKFKVKITVLQIGDELTYSVTNTGVSPNVVLYTGIFYITDIVKGRTDYTITAYDAVHKLDQDCAKWKETVLDPTTHDFASPMTLRQILNSICTYVGISADTQSFNNDSYAVNHCYIDDGVSLRQIIGYIAQAAGGFAHIMKRSNSYYLRITTLFTSTPPSFTPANYKKLEQADYTTEAINTVSILTQDGDIGVYSPVSQQGPGNNVLKIVNNPLLYIMDFASDGTPDPTRLQIVADNIYSAVRYSVYKPFKMTTFLENIYDFDGRSININNERTWPFSITWNKSGVTLEATGNKTREKTEFYSPGEQRMMGTYNIFKRTLGETVSELGNVSGQVSTISQTVNNISLEVADKVDKDDVIASINLSPETIKINASKIDVSGTLRLLGGPNNENGTLQLLDANNSVVGQWDNTGIGIWDSTSASTLSNATFRIVRDGTLTTSPYGVFIGNTQTYPSMYPNQNVPFITLNGTNNPSSSEQRRTRLTNDEYVNDWSNSTETPSPDNPGYTRIINESKNTNIQPSKIALNETRIVTDLEDPGSGVIPIENNHYQTVIEARPLAFDPYDGDGRVTISRTSGLYLQNYHIYSWGPVVQISLIMNGDGG